MTAQERERVNNLKFYREFNEVTSILQKDISRSLLFDPNHKANLTKQLKMSENDVELLLDKVAHTVLAVMPLASMNRTNMLGRILALHSNLTGDPMIHDMFDEITHEVLYGPESNLKD
jgi:hypothetical protein